jgi:hypothetical protein
MALQNNNEIPFIDPRVEYVGASKLRTLNTGNLGKLKKTLVIQDNDTPLAVLLGYEQYLIIQNKLQSLLKTIELLQDPQKASGVVAGIRDAANGDVVPFDEIQVHPK